MNNKVRKEFEKLSKMSKEELERYHEETGNKLDKRLEKFYDIELEANDRNNLYNHIGKYNDLLKKFGCKGITLKQVLKEFAEEIEWFNKIICELEFKYFSDHTIQGLKSKDALKRYSIVRQSHAKLKRLQKDYDTGICFVDNKCELHKQHVARDIDLLMGSYRDEAVAISKLEQISKDIERHIWLYTNNAKTAIEYLKNAKYIANFVLYGKDEGLYQPHTENDFRALKKAYNYYLENSSTSKFNDMIFRDILLFGFDPEDYCEETIFLISKDGQCKELKQEDLNLSLEDEVIDYFCYY